jgi:hypothetical protein
MRIAILFSVLVWTGAAFGADVADCPSSPKLTGACFTVHGRLSIANGFWNYRIWPVGTTRMLAVVDSADVYEEMAPPPLPKHVGRELNGSGTHIFGDYEVCPLTRSIPGHMQHVCVARASNLVVQTEGKPVRRIADTPDH